jgi:transcriptional regulator with XRE-family HTH domain
MQYDGKKIASLRESKGWSMGELARQARISQPSLWALEHQVTKKPKADTLLALSNALGVPLKALLRAKVSKRDIPTADELEAIFDALDDGNKQVIVAAAEAILKNQKK